MNKLSTTTIRAKSLIEEKGYLNSNGYKQVTSLQIEVDLKTIPYVEDERIFPIAEAIKGVTGMVQKTFNNNLSSSMRGYFGSDDIDDLPGTDQLGSLISGIIESDTGGTVICSNPSELLENETERPKDIMFNVVVKKLSDSQRITYAPEDMEYLEALWEQASFKNDEEAKSRLKDALKDIPEYGFVLKFSAYNVSVATDFPLLYMKYSIISYIIANITGCLPLSVVGDFSALYSVEGFNPAKDDKEYTSSFSPAFLDLVELHKEGDLSIEDLLSLVRKEYIKISVI